MKNHPAKTALRNQLESYIGVPIDLTITNNRHNMITCKWDNGVLKVRVHHMFTLAGKREIRSLASFCKRPNKSNRTAINRYIAAHEHLIEHKQTTAKPPKNILTQGEHHDLAAAFEKVNAKYFKRACDSVITWGQASRNRRARSIRLGSYDVETNVIRLHPNLDAAWVPKYIIEALIYHEILHWLFRPRRDGARNVIHSRALLDAEQAHPHYEKTKIWIDNNIERLLRG